MVPLPFFPVSSARAPAPLASHGKPVSHYVQEGTYE
jgi:hypothetical protein